LDFLLAGLGLVILLLAGDALVRGAVNLALRIGVPALLVSLSIVAFGTSAPELLIAIKAVLDDAPGIALGNVVGSNTANILLVLGIPALLAGIRTDDCEPRKSYLLMLGASVLFIAVCFAGPITWMHGLLLLAVLALILADQAREGLAHRRNGEPEEPELEGLDPEMAGWKVAVFLVLGLVGLPLGADILVDSSIDIARTFGVSETAIGLTLVAIGTSLPELATTVMAAYRKQADVALGNVIGSNLFNLMGIVGVAALFGDIAVGREFLTFDLWVMLAASLALAPFVFSKSLNLTKRWGALFSVLYLGYLYVVVA